MSEINENALNAATLKFVDSADSLGTPMPTPMMATLKRVLRAMIKEYESELETSENEASDG